MSLTFNLELTDHCNISCKMCSQAHRDEAHGVPHRFMEWDTWRRAIQGLVEVEQDVALCPHWLGEPTIHPQFDRFVEYAFAANRDNRLFREFKLHTNGVVFNEARARLLLRMANRSDMAEDTFRFVHFSIDAFSPEVYQIVKGADKREQVFKNVNRFLKIRSQLGLLRPHVTLAFVVQPENAHEVRLFRDYWKDQLEGLGRTIRQTFDWPDVEADTFYLRPLNCGEQDASDGLHAQIARELGLTPSAKGRLRAPASF